MPELPHDVRSSVAVMEANRRQGARLEAHPWLLVVGSFGLILGLSYGSFFVLGHAFPLMRGRYIAVVWEGLSAAVGITILGRVGWLRKVGFTGFSQWRSRYLLWWVTPFVLSAIVVDQKVSLSGGFDIAVAAVLTFLVALNEETIFRGAILQALLPRGVRRAIIIQGLLFGAFHTVNLIGGGYPPYVGGPVVVGGVTGVFFGAPP